MLDSRLRIIVTGLIAQHPRLGGVAWDYLQYALGLARLGHDVYYFEDSGEWPYRFDGGNTRESWIASDPHENVEHLATTMARFGLGDRWAYHFPIDDTWFGLADPRRADVIRTADLLVNVSGTLEDPDRYRRVPRLVYIDSDPVFTQVKLLSDADFARRVDAHDTRFSFGETIGESRFATEHRWQPTRQPIVLSEWRPERPRRSAYTTVMSWTSYRPLRFRGEMLGQKDVELCRFLNVAASAPVPLEIALGPTQHLEWQTENLNISEALAARLPATPKPEDLLAAAGFGVVDATLACATLDGYRDYVESSRGEWSVAKNAYVAGDCGWFSCRSACYLAAGRPVVVQDTGFGTTLPIGEGVLAFANERQAVDALRDVEADYERHARAARAVAEEYFDSRRVLAQLVEQATAASSHHERREPQPAGVEEASSR
jgi:hypothetical protein